MAKGNGSGRTANRQEILDAFKRSLAHEELVLPECGITVTVWQLTGPELVEYQEALTSSKHRIPIGKRGKREIEIESHAARGLLKLCAMSLKDENGHRQFEEADLAWIPAPALRRIFTVAERISSLNEEALEQMGEGSEAIQVVPSTSRSPLPSATEPSESSPKG